MGIFQTTINLSNGLTTVRVVGKMRADDFWDWVGDFYAGAVTSLVVWDLAAADLSDIGAAVTSDEIREHVRQVNQAAARVRPGGKTAYVVRDNQPALHLSRLIESLGETENSPFARKTFISMDDAMQWLGVKSA